ncbi:MAG: selenide, water dikinase SelD [Candidatus Latescibacteria bacterium]|nr:selenide, water dikinase SelD [Candidatus Latescibacterota bacterium]
MAQALAFLPEIKDPNLLVGLNTADDAGVYKLTDDLALVYTVDVFTPVVDDPYTFGMIGAANSISDIYAMGGDPKLALNVVGFPGKAEPGLLGQMLKGAQDKAQEAGVTICGGHTFVSDEIKFGLSVIGYINPKKIITNANAQVGDIIILTKPIGIGTIVQAQLMEKPVDAYLTPAINSMTTLNKDASLAMRESAHAATDITGYGLAGHLVEMAQASKIGIEISIANIPFHKGVMEILKSGIIEPGIGMNLNSFDAQVDRHEVDDADAMLVFGSETSGGLAIAMPENKLAEFKENYRSEFAVIGKITKENSGRVKITP